MSELCLPLSWDLMNCLDAIEKPLIFFRNCLFFLLFSSFTVFFFSFHVVPSVEFFLVVHRLDSLSLCYVSFVVRSAVLLLSLVSRVQTIVQACITGSKL
jgi:hypothetical protein